MRPTLTAGLRLGDAATAGCREVGVVGQQTAAAWFGAAAADATGTAGGGRGLFEGCSRGRRGRGEMGEARRECGKAEGVRDSTLG